MEQQRNVRTFEIPDSYRLQGAAKDTPTAGEAAHKTLLPQIKLDSVQVPKITPSSESGSRPVSIATLKQTLTGDSARIMESGL